MKEIKGHFPTPLIIVLFLFVSLSVSSPTMTAEFYKWKDKNGNVFFSDRPPPADANAEVIRLKPEPPPTPTITPRVNSPKVKSEKPEGKRSYISIDVILYGTSWCGYCRKAKEYLRSLNVNLVEYDVERDPSKGREMLIKSGGARGVPLIDVEGIIIHGYSESAIRQAVEKRREGQT